GIRRVDASSFEAQVAAQVNDVDPLEHIGAQRGRRVDRYSQFAVASAQQAVLDAGLGLSTKDAEQTGVYLGSALGGLSFAEEQNVEFMDKGLRAVNSILALTVFGSASSGNIALEMGLFGPNQTNANSCASGAVAV